MIQERYKAAISGKRDPRIHYQWTDWEEISPYVAIAVVAGEDQKFPLHCGFDVGSIQDAIRQNPHRRSLRGASTISQQVTKNLFLWPGRNLVRKSLEAYFTVLIELFWPKRRILEVYLNIAQFGPSTFGVRAASEACFRKPPSRLDLREAALLAAVLPNPKRFDPANPSDYVRKRAEKIQQEVRRLGGPEYLKRLQEPKGRFGFLISGGC